MYRSKCFVFQHADSYLICYQQCANPDVRPEPGRVPQRHQPLQARAPRFPNPTQGVLWRQRGIIPGRKRGGSPAKGARGARGGDAHPGHAQAFTTRRQGRGHLITDPSPTVRRGTLICCSSDVFSTRISCLLQCLFSQPLTVVIYPAFALVLGSN